MSNIDNMINNSLNSNMPPISVLADAKVAMATAAKPTRARKPLWVKMTASFASLLVMCTAVFWVNLVFGGANAEDNDYAPAPESDTSTAPDADYTPDTENTDGTIDAYECYYAYSIFHAYGMPSLDLGIDYCRVYADESGDVIYVCENYLDSSSGILATLHVVDNNYLDIEIYNLHSLEGYGSIFGDDAQYQTIAGIEVAVWQSGDSYGSDIWCYGGQTEQYQWFVEIESTDQDTADAIVSQWLLELMQ